MGEVDSKTKALATILSKLAVHYYRPEFTEGEARSLISDYIEDLHEFEVRDVEDAIREYRRAPDSEFFPKIGRLRGLATEVRRERIDHEKFIRQRRALSDRPYVAPQESRPIFWWTHPRQYWKPHWRESEIPEEYREAFERRQRAIVF